MKKSEFWIFAFAMVFFVLLAESCSSSLQSSHTADTKNQNCSISSVSVKTDEVTEQEGSDEHYIKKGCNSAKNDCLSKLVAAALAEAKNKCFSGEKLGSEGTRCKVSNSQFDEDENVEYGACTENDGITKVKCSLKKKVKYSCGC